MKRVFSAFSKKSAGKRLENRHKQHMKKVRKPGLTDFSDVEDSTTAFSTLKYIAAKAGRNAAAEAKAAGLSRIYLRNNKGLVRVTPAGDEEVIASKYQHSSFYIKFKPNTVLHAVKK